MSNICDVEASLETYSDQLKHVNNALQDKPDDQELMSLKRDLQEIIAITEEELLNLKKSQLLRNLEEKEESDESTDDGIGSLVGMKCSIPYTTKWGRFQQQNCVILSAEYAGESDIRVKVIFLTPSSKEMLPCKQNLNSECKFDKCRFSHGHEVDVSELCEYQEPNFEKFEKGKRCLCKNEDGLWSPGTVTSVNVNEVYIKLDGSSCENPFSYEDLFPLQSCSDGESDDDNDWFSDPDSSLEASVLSGQAFSKSQSLNFGEWETHTNSFGSKMLLKMGYTPGCGLGIRKDGILEPIKADVIPPGVSLDTVKQMREKNLIRTVYKLNVILKKKHELNSNLKDMKSRKSKSMFQVINSVMKSRAVKQKHVDCPKNKKSLNKVADKTVRVKSVSLENDIIRCKQRLSNLQQSLSRNKNDTLHCTRVRNKIKEETEELATLERRQEAVEKEIKFRNDKKKLKIF